MGRDDARPVAGLQGGRAPATAFAAFMRQATSDIPVSELTTSFDLPGNQMEPDDEVYGIIENGVSTGQLVDPDGMPIDGSQRMEDQHVDPRLEQPWLDRVLSDQYQPARPNQQHAGPSAAHQSRAHAGLVRQSESRGGRG